jgi:hypothetical protein
MSPWKWPVLAALLVLVGILLAASLGTKRGTRLYRLRVRLWSAAVVLAAAGGLVLTSSGCRNKQDQRPMCYDTVQVRDAGIDDEPEDPGAVENVEEAKEE